MVANQSIVVYFERTKLLRKTGLLYYETTGPMHAWFAYKVILVVFKSVIDIKKRVLITPDP